MLWVSPDAVSWTGEALSVPQARFGDGTDSIHLGFTQWELNEDNGSVTALEYVKKLVNQNDAVPVLYRSTDGVQFEVINEEITGTPILTRVTIFRPPSE